MSRSRRRRCGHASSRRLLAPIVVVCWVAFTPEGFLSFPTDRWSLRWFTAIAERPATKAAYARAPEVNPDFGKTMSEDAKKVMFGQTAASTKR